MESRSFFMVGMNSRVINIFLVLAGLSACEGITEELKAQEGGAGGKVDGQNCDAVVSNSEDFAPIQVVGEAMPALVSELAWVRPTVWTSIAPFAGEPGRQADHEGDDYIHADASMATVGVVAAAEGIVVYVRKGCPQSSQFERNELLRECGSGWGNHVVLSHGNGVYTRYGHLAPESIIVFAGDPVEVGAPLASMGNSGRSELRHLHFELGTTSEAFDSCAMSQSFEYVFSPGQLPFASAYYLIIETDTFLKREIGPSENQAWGSSKCRLFAGAQIDSATPLSVVDDHYIINMITYIPGCEFTLGYVMLDHALGGNT